MSPLAPSNLVFSVPHTMQGSRNLSRIPHAAHIPHRACCDVAIESVSGQESSSIDMLRERRMQVVANARAWPGGAVATVVSGAPPAGQPWNAVRTRWTDSTEDIEGGSELIPPALDGSGYQVVHLPGGVWVEFRRSPPIVPAPPGACCHRRDLPMRCTEPPPCHAHPKPRLLFLTAPAPSSA